MGPGDFFDDKMIARVRPPQRFRLQVQHFEAQEHEIVNGLATAERIYSGVNMTRLRPGNGPGAAAMLRDHGRSKCWLVVCTLLLVANVPICLAVCGDGYCADTDSCSLCPQVRVCLTPSVATLAHSTCCRTVDHASGEASCAVVSSQAPTFSHLMTDPQTCTLRAIAGALLFVCVTWELAAALPSCWTFCLPTTCKPRFSLSGIGYRDTRTFFKEQETRATSLLTIQTPTWT